MCRFAGRYRQFTLRGKFTAVDVDVLFHSIEFCQNSIQFHPIFNQSMLFFLSNYRAHHSFLIQGNLGAGLFCNDELAGILSFGFACGQPNQPAVFTQTRFYDEWINQQLTRQDTVQPGTIIGASDA